MTAEQRRTQLLDVTAELIHDEGFAAISIDRIAREANIARTVVYSQFGDLAGLLDALTDRTQEAALRQVRELVPEPPIEAPADDILLEAIASLLDLIHAEPRTWRLVLQPPEGAPLAQRKRMAAGRDAVTALLVPVCEWGLQARGGPKGLDAELFARTLVTLTEDGARLSLRDPERYPPERILDFARTILNSLRPDDDTAPKGQ